jgi:hypothetical protein
MLSVSSFQNLNQWNDFDENWYELYAIERYTKAKLRCRSDTTATFFKMLNLYMTIYAAEIFTTFVNVRIFLNLK